MHRPRFASAPLAMVRFQNGWLSTYQVADLAILESGSGDPQAPVDETIGIIAQDFVVEQLKEKSMINC